MSNRRGLIMSGLLLLALATATVFAWVNVDGNEGAGSASDGTATFQNRGCGGCHSIAGLSTEASLGPDLTKLAERAGDRVEGLGPREYVIQSVRSPQAYIVPGYTAIMPTIELTDEELDSLATFLLEDR